MTTLVTRKYVLLGGRFIAGLILLSAATFKIVRPAEFWLSVNSLWPMSALDAWWTKMAAGSVVALEISLAICLLCGLWLRESLSASILLVLAFTLIVAPQWSGTCSCSWKLPGLLVPSSVEGFLARNAIVIIGLALLLKHASASRQGRLTLRVE